MTSLFPVAAGDTTDLVTADLADDLIDVGSSLDTGQTSYLKFTKTGNWVFGRDDNEVDPEELIAVNPTSFTIGWKGWNNGTPVSGPIVPIKQRKTLPKEDELEVLPAGEMNGWSKVLGVSLQSMADGTPLQYDATSYHGKEAVTKLMKEIGLGLKEHAEAPVALVKLTGDKYKHKTYGSDVHYPVFTIVGWADGEGKEVKKLAA